MGAIDDLDSIYESYALEFPESERKTKDQLKQLMRRGAYVLLIAEKHGESGSERIGFACLYVPISEDFIWLDYLVIERAYQSKGYGSKFLEEIMRRWSERRGMFIEVEIPTGKDIDQDRRIAYYERHGAKRLPINYHLPTEVNEMPMYLYYSTLSSDDRPSNEYIEKAIISANTTIHWDHAYLESVWQKNQFI
jgi:ribosomal protein S18 acetylase RimI-like enzyme